VFPRVTEQKGEGKTLVMGIDLMRFLRARYPVICLSGICKQQTQEIKIGKFPYSNKGSPMMQVPSQGQAKARVIA
jgi:hypothetical protein